jgi:hypothetical protein
MAQRKGPIRSTERLPSVLKYPIKKRPTVALLNKLDHKGESRTMTALNIAEGHCRILLENGDSLAAKYDNFKVLMMNRGYLLYDMPVTPEDAGYEATMEEVNVGDTTLDKYVYRRGDFYLWHVSESKWCVKKTSWAAPIILEFKNMTDFIVSMRCMGDFISVDDVILRG